MDITLIYPSQRKSNPGFKWWKQPRSHRYPGLGLLTVAALCPSYCRIKLVDDDCEKIDTKENTDLVGISVLTINAFRAYEISQHFREKNTTVVLGGMHVSACPEEAAKHADAIVIGEAEDTWPILLQDFEEGTLKKVYRSSNSSELSNMPRPRRDLLVKKKYVTVNTVQATRGCPFNCEFCSITSLFGPRTRFRPVGEVIEEIKSLEGKIFLLNDDNIAQMSGYYRTLFQRLIPLKKTWAGNASWNIAKDEEMLKLLEKSGCRGLFIGFESLSPQPGVKKISASADNILLYKETVQKLHERRIKVIGAFIFGFDHEDESVFDRTLEFILDSQMDAAQLNVLTPFPGTPLYRRLKKEGRITESSWNNYMTSKLCFQLQHMSEKTFMEKFTRMKRKFHTYPNIGVRILRAAKISTPFELGVLLGINLGNRKSIVKFMRHHPTQS